MSSKNFLESNSYSEFAKSLSVERLSTYRTFAGSRLTDSLRLYTWNTAISAAFYGPLQGLEVALRNAMHRELSWRYGPSWFDNPDTALDEHALRNIDRAKMTLGRTDREIDAAQVVAALAFGFWVSLVDSGGKQISGCKADYEETLWRPALHRVFPPHKSLTRKMAHKPLNYLRNFRNRIAHHEPIFKRDLCRDHETILEVTKWISPGTAAWICHHSRVSELLLLKDTDQVIKF